MTADESGKKTHENRNLGGRPKGVPNKTTILAREAIARFVDGNAHRLEGWLEEIAREEGAKTAFNCFMDVVEYHVPKLQRTELTGKDGGAIEVKATQQDEKL
jgi:hypothetical protein